MNAPSERSSGSLLFVISLVLLGRLFTALPASASNDAMEKARTFEADFLGQGAQGVARSRAGEVRARLHGGDTVREEVDLVAHSGIWGIRVGSDGASLEFPTADLLPRERGSVELLLRAGDWAGDESKVPVFWQTIAWGDTPGKLILYRMGRSGFSAYLQYGSQQESLFIGSNKHPPEPHAMHHLVATWDQAGEFSFYLDGVLVGSHPLPATFDWPESFSIGPVSDTWGTDGTHSTIVRNAIYDRVLDAVTVRERAAAQLPQGTEAEGEAEPEADVRKPNGSPTAWWDGQPRLALEALEPDYVPPPWTPVHWDGGAGEARVWGRTYDLADHRGLIGGVTASGGELLKASIVLEASRGADSETLVFGPPAEVSAKAGRLVLSRSVNGRLARGRAVFTVEYDGLVDVRLDLVPLEGPLTALSLTVPFHADAAELIHYVGAPHRYESQNLLRNSQSIALPAEPGEGVDLPFKTMVWIGNTHRGLLWYAGSDENWWPLEREDAIRVERAADGSALLRLDWLKAPLPAPHGESLSYAFGFMATPVRPLPEGWRGWSVSAQYESFTGDRRGTHLIYWPDRWRTLMLDPDPHRAQNVERMREKVVRDRAEGRKIIPYWTRIHLPLHEGQTVNPDGMRMMRLWGNEPDRPRGGQRDMARVCATTGWQDYLVWCFDQWSQVFGTADGWYLDETQPIPNTRAASGGGYTAADGSRRPTFEFHGSRDMVKRVTWLARQAGAGEGSSAVHNSATYTLPSMSHFALFITGEHMNSGYYIPTPEILPPDDEMLYFYSYVLPMDRLRAEGFSRQWGIPVAWMGQLKNHREIMNHPTPARDFLSRTLQVDALYWPLWLNAEEFYRVQRFKARFGVADPEVEFIPYWENTSVTCATEGVKVGYYRSGSKALVLVSNLNREPAEARIAIGALDPRTVRNAETGEGLPVDDGAVLLSLPRNDYRALAVNH